jgi:hypothetical protein
MLDCCDRRTVARPQRLMHRSEGESARLVMGESRSAAILDRSQPLIKGMVILVWGLLAVVEPWSWLGRGQRFALAGSPEPTWLVRSAAQQPAPTPPDSGGPSRSQGSGTR